MKFVYKRDTNIVFCFLKSIFVHFARALFLNFILVAQLHFWLEGSNFLLISHKNVNCWGREDNTAYTLTF